MNILLKMEVIHTLDMAENQILWLTKMLARYTDQEMLSNKPVLSQIEATKKEVEEA